MKISLKYLAALAAALWTGLLLTSCAPFQAREVEVVRSSLQESKNYYLFTAGGGEKLSFESRNYLSSNLLMDDFFSDGEKLVHRLAEFAVRRAFCAMTRSMLVDGPVHVDHQFVHIAVSVDGDDGAAPFFEAADRFFRQIEHILSCCFAFHSKYTASRKNQAGIAGSSTVREEEPANRGGNRKKFLGGFSLAISGRSCYILNVLLCTLAEYIKRDRFSLRQK